MLSRTWLLLFLAGAIGLPYLLSNSSGLHDSLSGIVGGEPQIDAPTEKTPGQPHPVQPHTVAAHPGAVSPASAQPPEVHPWVDGPREIPIHEVFRFDVTTAWVMGQWPRVTTRLAELDLQGYRVALVTGTRESDLAGSLTYYFNKQQRVEKITFRGTTGDTRPLVAYLANHHQFIRQTSNDPGLHVYEVQEKGKSISQLRIMARSVLYNSDPHGRFQIDLTMQRPSTTARQ